ncbi:unnamed protein product, partial [Amoebophrya sp. A25]
EDKNKGPEDEEEGGARPGSSGESNAEDEDHTCGRREEEVTRPKEGRLQDSTLADETPSTTDNEDHNEQLQERPSALSPTQKK